jgi:dolichyl-phosphate-mannose-protein mannosyltransferase
MRAMERRRGRKASAARVPSGARMAPRAPRTRAPWVIAPFALGAFAWFAYQASALWLTYPIPWPDEALFSDVSVHLIRHGRLATDLYAEFFPSMREHYYLTPPLYHLMQAGWFALFGVSIGAVRSLSVLTALAVMIATYGIGRRLGLSRLVALVPSALLALDAVFLRASLLGRMDLLTLLFILLSIWLALDDPKARAGRRGGLSRRAFLLGLMSALAVLTHPIGFVAMAVGLGWAVTRLVSLHRGRESPPGDETPGGQPARIVLPLALGIALGLLPWGWYASRDLHAFVAQIGGQLQRKGSRDSILSCVSIESSQWGIDLRLVFGAWLAGIAGLALIPKRRDLLLVILGAQILLTAVILKSCEIWYPVYVLPLTYIGIGTALNTLGTRQAKQRVVGIAVAAIALVFAQQNMSRVSTLRRQREAFDAGAQYSSWCRAIGDFLPKNSEVLMDLLPTPYFGLDSREDLALRLFPPAGFKTSATDTTSSLEGIDYVISGRTLANPQLRTFLLSHGGLVAEIGERAGPGYYAAVIKVRP